jgi:predicted cupin superfamily sugar epimerase
MLPNCNRGSNPWLSEMRTSAPHKNQFNSIWHYSALEANPSHYQNVIPKGWYRIVTAGGNPWLSEKRTSAPHKNQFNSIWYNSSLEANPFHYQNVIPKGWYRTVTAGGNPWLSEKRTSAPHKFNSKNKVSSAPHENQHFSIKVNSSDQAHRSY